MGALPLVQAACRLDINEIIQGLSLLSDYAINNGRKILKLIFAGVQIV